jgi:hypothetical protein
MTDEGLPGISVPLAGHAWHAWTREIGPWTTPEFEGWEIIHAVADDGKTKYMIYHQYVHQDSCPTLEEAAMYVADHSGLPRNVMMGPPFWAV